MSTASVTPISTAVPTATPPPITNVATGVQVSGTLATVETIAADIFELGLGAVGVFVKNSAHQATAVNIANVLKTVFPFL